MSKFTFLEQEQYDEDKIYIIETRGAKAAITDFSILLGGYVANDCHIDGDDSLAGRTGYYWTKSSDDINFDVCIFGNIGSYFSEGVGERVTGARPALSFSSIDKIPTNQVSGAPKKAKDGVLEVEYGFYPQKAVNKRTQDELEMLFETKSTKLQKTGNGYTTDSKSLRDYWSSFEAQKHEEYIYEKTGKRYVRVIANLCNENTKLSNGQTYNSGDAVWVEVEPIKWIVDEKAKVMLTDKIVFAGVQFAKYGTYYHTEDFEKTNIYKFTNEEWARDIEQVRDLSKSEVKSKGIKETRAKRSRLERMNPDTTRAEDRRTMTDTEMIHSWIENGESVLLRGPSGIGKTDRIRKLYPNLIELKLTNNMFPEKVVGSTNIQTGQEIPPSYAKQIIMQAATEEERQAVEENIQNIYEIADQIYERSQVVDEKQVILLDELLNVNPHVQSLVYTLVLNRFVEIGKGIKLPDNIVIVATGNQQKYSSTSYDLAEPLEKRFDHILDMEPKVGEWLTEYAIPHKVHPTVIGYIMSKYNSTGKVKICLI